MLYKYKNDYAKIAMGLLSFIPDLKAFNNLQIELQWYANNSNRALLLWKNKYGDFTGIIGLLVLDSSVLVRHIAVTPTERDGRLVYDLLDAVAQLYPTKKVLGSLDIAALFTKWEKREYERTNNT